MGPKVFLAEAIGTFLLVAAGTAAIAFDQVHGGLGSAGIAAAFGSAVWVAVGALGPVSGAHINPAVSVGFWLAGRLRGSSLAGYVSAQGLGALAASACVALYAPPTSGLGATVPTVPLGFAFLLEIALTMVLMLVILLIAGRRVRSSWFAGIGIGGWVALAAWSSGAWTGASMNPARSLGPALMSGQTALLWLYLSAPVAGAALAVIACRELRGGPCCRAGAVVT